MPKVRYVKTVKHGDVCGTVRQAALGVYDEAAWFQKRHECASDSFCRKEMALIKREARETSSRSMRGKNQCGYAVHDLVRATALLYGEKKRVQMK